MLSASLAGAGAGAPAAASTILTAKARRGGALTYGWTTPDDPDVTGKVLAAVRRFLRSKHGKQSDGNECLKEQEED